MVKFNKVKERFIFLSPTVQAGWEDESEIEDFNLTKHLGKGIYFFINVRCVWEGFEGGSQKIPIDLRNKRNK